MKMIIVHSISSLKETFEARASEWALASAIFMLALVFIINDTMFLDPAFLGLRTIIRSQETWAVIFLILGVVRLAVLLVNGAYWRTPHLRAATAFLCAGVWFLLIAGFARNGDPLLALLPPIFFLDAYNAKRASREAGKSEYLQRRLRKRQNEAHATVSNP